MRETPKFDLWSKYFFDQTDSVCRGNATQSAIKAYHYNPKTQYNLASVTGSNNIRKHKYLATTTLDMMGYGYGDLLKILLKKAIDGSYSDFENFMIRIGSLEEMPSAQVNIQENHFNFNDVGKAMNKSRIARGLPPL